MKLTLRPLKRSDNVPLAILIREVFEEFGIDRPGTVYTDPTTDSLFEVFENENSKYFVAIADDALAGGCGIFPTPGLPENHAELVKFYLLAKYRGLGIGSKLLLTLINEARAKGYTHLYLESFPELNTAVNLYEKMGFTHLSAPLGNSGHFACSIWMIKDLTMV